MQRLQRKKDGKTWKRYRHGSWRKLETKKRWSQKQGMKAEKFSLRHWWISVISRMPNWRAKHQKYKGRVVLRGDIVKDDPGSYAVFTEQGSWAHKWQPRKSWISYPDCRDAQDKQQTQYPLKPRSKWKMHRRLLKIPKSECQTFGYVYQSTNGPNHGPVWKTQLSLLNGICTVILWQDSYGKGNLRKSYWNMAGRKFQIVNVSLYIVEKGLFLSMYVDDIKLAGRNKILNRCGKYSTKKLISENQHLSLIMYTWAALKDNVK